MKAEPRYRLVIHRWHGLIPWYEVQAYSSYSQKWYVRFSGSEQTVKEMIEAGSIKLESTIESWHE